MAREESAGINIGDMVACYVPYYAMPDGIDIGVVLNRYTMDDGVYYRVNWLHGGILNEAERILSRNRNLYQRLMKESLYVESIQET